MSLPVGPARWRPHPVVVLGLAYVAGAVPFSNLMARARTGRDLRGVGTGTVSATGLGRVAGFGPMAIAGLADVAKGTVGPLLAGPDRPVLSALAGGAAVCGHNWSVFLGGSGGRGISPSIGALAVRNPLGSVILLSGLGGGRLVEQTGLGCFVAGVALVPSLRRAGGREGAIAGAAVAVPMLAKRLVGNHPPPRRDVVTYLARLVFDRDTWKAPER
ncbi:MAG: glycerol-3-phosphate acyltransferase [Acidimicrobiales bacterium]